MKTIYTFLFLLLVNISAFSQNEATIVWQKCLGGIGNENANSIQQTFDGGYIVASTSNSTDGDVTGNHGDYDYWIVKLDNNGNIQWQRSFGGSAFEAPRCIQQTIDSGYIIAGESASIDGDVIGNHSTSSDYWIVKLDWSGNVIWKYCYGGTDSDQARYIQQTTDSGYIIVGNTSSFDGDVTGLHSAQQDGWIVKLNSNGIIQWQKCVGGLQGEYLTSIRQTEDGGYIAAGSSSSNDGDVTGNHGGGDIWVVRLDGSGTILWQKCLGGTDIEEAESIQQTSDHGYIVAGFTRSNDGDVSGYHGEEDYLVIKLDSSGNIQWQKCYGGSIGWDFGVSIEQTNDGGYIMAGESGSIDGDVVGNHGALYTADFWIIKIDSSGSLVWQKCLGGTGHEGAYCIKQTSNDEYVVAGYTESNNGDVSGYHGNGTTDDTWVVKITTRYNSITGKTFLDMNSNLVQDTLEPSLAHHTIHESITGRLAITQPAGSYELTVLDTGNYSVYPSSISYYNIVPVSHPASFSGMYQVDSLNDFAFQPTGTFNDLNVTITPISPFRPGFNAHYRIHYKNVGTTSLTGTVIFYPDPNVGFVSSAPIPTTTTVDSMIWNLPLLAPYDEGNILVTVSVSGSVVIGSHLYSSANIEPVSGDANPVDNVAQWDVIVGGSYDPNEILVSRYSLTTTEVASQPYLDYVINFQNTGTDTAFNVKVLNVIPLNLDLSSFEFLESSHPVQINFNNSDRQMSFEFNNIQLADSNVNETLSHGYLRYRIKPLATLAAADSIANKAYITFDFNASVGTNYAVTEITLPTFISPVESTHDFVIYPNPASSSFTIQTEEHFKNGEVMIYDVIGKEVLYKKLSSTKTEIHETLQRGIYFVKIKSEESFVVKKLIIN